MVRTMGSNLPKFDGSNSVTGFFDVFEEMCDRLGCLGDEVINFLLANLKGNVIGWLHTQKGWRLWSYSEMKAALIAEYGISNIQQVSRL